MLKRGHKRKKKHNSPDLNGTSIWDTMDAQEKCLWYTATLYAGGKATVLKHFSIKAFINAETSLEGILVFKAFIYIQYTFLDY